MKPMPLLIGEDNPQSARPEHALWPSPPGCAGHRLCYKILGAPSEHHYLWKFLRYNLCTGRWDLVEAERRAHGIELLYQPNVKILLGAKVAAAFDLPFEPFAQTWWPTESGRGPMLVLPHPSGRCRIWNDPKSYARAQKALKEILT